MNISLKLVARNKAKEDIDLLMLDRDFRNVAIGSSWGGSIGRFFAKLLTVACLPFRVSRGDTLLVQYPFKKYYPTVCRIMHWRGGHVVTLIHDLGCFRRKKLTIEQEVRKLMLTDVLIVHNDSMLRFLRDHGYQRPMLTLDIFDYLAPSQDEPLPVHEEGQPWDVVYAGGLAERKNRFLYDLDKRLPDDCCWHLYIHGKGLDEEKAAHWHHITMRGFIGSDDFVRHSIGHFGLVWDGSSVDECAGAWGEYLKVNNPHKTSFYLRSGKPVIIWRDAALAPFVEREGVGITVGSLAELHDRLSSVTTADYEAMLRRVEVIRERLAKGYYFEKAFTQALTFIPN